MSFHTKPRIKEIIQRAGALSGVDASVFTMDAVDKAAMNTISAHEQTQLQPVDYAAFFPALDHPPEPTNRLRAAFIRHHETIISK